MSDDIEVEMETLAAFVHGALAFGHVLGFIYNIRRRNRFDAFMHLCGVIYDGFALDRHRERVREYTKS